MRVVALRSFLVLTWVAFIGSGCGMSTPTGVTAPASYMYSQGAPGGQATSSQLTDPNNYTCPTNVANISPVDFPGNGPTPQDYFNLCKSKIASSDTNLRIIPSGGTPALNPWVCIFAANATVVAGSTVRSWIPNNSDPTMPLYQCVDLSQQRAYLSFPASLRGTWNAAYIVRRGSEGTMINYLKNPSGNLPPNYSFGMLY